jgi:hypothetical protein
MKISAHVLLYVLYPSKYNFLLLKCELEHICDNAFEILSRLFKRQFYMVVIILPFLCTKLWLLLFRKQFMSSVLHLVKTISVDAGILLWFLRLYISLTCTLPAKNVSSINFTNYQFLYKHLAYLNMKSLYYAFIWRLLV